MSALAIRASNITRRYGERAALDGFSIEVPTGGVFGVLGPNGSGKSRCIAMLGAREAPEGGKREVLGVARTRVTVQRVGTVFQETSAGPVMRAGEYLRFAGSRFGMSGGELRTRIPELLTRFWLEPRTD